MLATLQKCLTASLAFASLAAYWSISHFEHPVGALFSAAIVWFSYAIVLGAEFVALHVVQRRSRSHPAARLGALIMAWASEVVSTPRVFFWRQPFRSRACPDHFPHDASGRHGIVLVHGLVCNRGFWNPWMSRLRHRNTPFVAPNLEPLFGSIDQYVELIDDAVRRMECSTNLPVVIVGHSMGGLAIRAWLNAHHAESRVHRIVTIASPHRGTWLARCSTSVNGRQMRTGSAWLTHLASTDSAEGLGRFTCFYGNCDNIVFPAELATLPGASNVHLPGLAHVRMAFEPVVFQEVCRWADQPGTTTRHPQATGSHPLSR